MAVGEKERCSEDDGGNERWMRNDGELDGVTGLITVEDW